MINRERSQINQNYHKLQYSHLIKFHKIKSLYKKLLYIQITITIRILIFKLKSPLINMDKKLILKK
jgi:hypothetical protein